MAFIAMVFASIFLIVVAIGFFILLIGIILDIIWGVRKYKQKKVSKILIGFAIVLTIWGVVQGIGPLAVVGVMSLSKKHEYRSEITDLPDDAVVSISDDADIYTSFDFKGVHYVPDEDLHPQVSHDNYKTEKIGAFVYESGKHAVIAKVINDRDENIVELGHAFNVYVEQSELENINDYYLNKSPLYCEVDKDLESAGKDLVEGIDSDRIRAIRDYVYENGHSTPGFDYDETMEYGYMFFYSYDDMYCLDWIYCEAEDGLTIEYKGKRATISDKDAEYIRSLIK